MKRIVIALLLISGASSVCRAQMLTYDAQNFVQALLGYLRDGETSAENAALFLEDIGISTEMLSSIREWNDRYREISQAVATAKAVLDIAASYEQTYADFAYFVSGFKELDMDYYEVHTFGLIDYARAAEYNMAELQDAFSVPYD